MFAGPLVQAGVATTVRQFIHLRAQTRTMILDPSAHHLPAFLRDQQWRVMHGDNEIVSRILPQKSSLLTRCVHNM
jgi:hypothetical protein